MKTTNHTDFWSRFWKMPVVGIVRNIGEDRLKKMLPLYIKAGFQQIEITMNTAGAERIIETAISQYGTDLNIGAGTVCTMEELERALSAGARFIVTPIVNEELIRYCSRKDIPVFPGAFTATEIYKAWQAGAQLIKLFPFTSLQPAYIKDMAGPFPGIKLMPTGGVGIHNCTEVFRAGAAAIGVGSQLFDKQLIADGNWDGLEEHFMRFAQTVSAALSPHS